MLRLVTRLALMFATAVSAGCAHGRRPQLNLLLGYAHVQMQEQEGLAPIVDDQGGARGALGIDAALSKSTSNGSGARLGGRFVFSGFREDVGERIVAGEPLLEIEDFVDLSLFTPQFVASYRQVIGDGHGPGAFIEPGFGAGPTIGVMSFGSELQFDDHPVGTSFGDSEVELGVSLNPFLRGGYTNGRLFIGAEGGYQWTLLEFDDALGEDPSEWYIGFFFGMQFPE